MARGARDDLAEPIEDWWDDFRRSLARRGRSADTVKVYRKSFESFWRWAHGAGVEPDPAAVDHRTINRWTDALLTMPVTRNGRPVLRPDPTSGELVPKPLEASTRRILYANLRPFFSWWAREADATNPFDRADPPGDDRPAPVPTVPLDDVRAVLAMCATKSFEDLRDAAIVRVLADTGARRGELTNLQVDDFDRRNDLLRLSGKTGTRVVPVAPATGEALARYLRARNGHRLAARPELWLGPKGALRDSGVAQLLRRRCEQAGIAHINPHRLRHTWAHEFRSEGGGEGDLMYLAGWSSPAMAHRYGRSAAAERATQVARRIALGDRL